MLLRPYFLTFSLFLTACGPQTHTHPPLEDLGPSDMNDMGIHDQTFDLPEAEYTDGDDPEGPAQIHPGVGSSIFSPVLQGTPVRWEMGFQGGYHMWVALKIDGEFLANKSQSELNQTKHRYVIRRSDATLLAAFNTQGGFVADDHGDFEFTGGWAVFEAYDFTPYDLEGEALFYQIALTFPGNETYTSHVWLKSECCDF